MASNLSKAIAENRFYISINSNIGKRWRDFTLQSGHVWGYAPTLKGINGMNGCFVVRREQLTTIDLYVCKPVYEDRNGTCEGYKWDNFTVSKDGLTGQKIMDVLSKRIGNVTFAPIRDQMKGVYNPPIIRGCKYTPMPSMRIPGGAYKTVSSETIEYHGINGPRPSEMDLVLRNIYNYRKYQERLNKK